MGESPKWPASATGRHDPNGDLAWNSINTCAELIEVMRKSDPEQVGFGDTLLAIAERQEDTPSGIDPSSGIV